MNRIVVLAVCALACTASIARGQTPADDKPSVEIYVFAQADVIADFKQNDPNWFDVVRPSRLPNVANQFGEDGRTYFGVRQSRFGTRATLPTSNGDVFAQ